MMRTTRLLVIAALCFAAPAAIAGGSPDPAVLKQAQDLYTQGDTAYNLGRFDEAVTWFTKAYETWNAPEFLYNIAQAHRQAGHCKEALYFYQRYRSLKDASKAPLTKSERDEVGRFIDQLTPCAQQAASTAQVKPDTLNQPSGTPPQTQTPPPAPITTPPPAPAPAPAPAPKVADATPAAPETTDDSGVTATTTTEPPHAFAAYAAAGISKIGVGNLGIPVQPSLVAGAAYPIALGPIVLDVGAGVSYAPLPYDAMGVKKSGTLLGARVALGATYPLGDRLAIRGELGAGLADMSGLADGNPLTTDRKAGSFAMPSARVGVAAEYAFTRNLLATVSPSFSYIVGDKALYSSSITEIDVVVGLGYRL